MTSLRSFQNEIDQIHHREVVKQRAQAAAGQDNAKDTKTPVKSPTKVVAVAGDKNTEKGAGSESQTTPADTENDAAADQADNDSPVDQDKIQVHSGWRESLGTETDRLSLDITAIGPYRSSPRSISQCPYPASRRACLPNRCQTIP